MYHLQNFHYSTVKTHKALETSEITKAVMILSRSSEFELEYAGIALILNMATIGERMIMAVIEAGGVELLTNILLDVTKEPLHTIASKALTTIGRKSTCSI